MDGLALLATIVFVLFAFGYGACFGSFLNVVVWRIPRRMPILVSRSHCPKCKHPIPGTDNIPVFGWLRLKGRCRFCQQPISIRYPLVEAGVGFLFATLFLLIVVAHGVTLPQGWLNHRTGDWLSELPRCPLFAVYFHEIILGYFLAGIVLIDEDQHLVPWRWTGTGLLLHLLIASIEPAVGQMDYLSAHAGELKAPEATWSKAGAISLVGFVFACGYAGLARLFKQSTRFGNLFQALVLLGVFLGPVVISWAFLMALVSMASQRIMSELVRRSRPSLPMTTSGWPLQLALAWLLILCTWRWWPLVQWG